MKIKKNFINQDKINIKIKKEEKYLKGLIKLIESDAFSIIQDASFNVKIKECKERIKNLKSKL